MPTFGNPTNQRGLRWLERKFNDDADAVLGPITTMGTGGIVVTIPGHARCAVIGLERGPCKMRRLTDSRHCYYHHKMEQGLLDPENAESYPVLPLPRLGYTLVSDGRTARAAA